jgi:hypothetical protein
MVNSKKHGSASKYGKGHSLLNPISFLIIFLHSLSAMWTNLLILTLALLVFIHSHFHYSLIFISLTAFLLYGPASTVSLNSLSCHVHAQLSIGSLNLQHSHSYSLHLMSYHFISSFSSHLSYATFLMETSLAANP